MPPPLDLNAPPKNKKIVFDDDDDDVQLQKVKEPKKFNLKNREVKTPLDLNAPPKNKKIVFDDDDDGDGVLLQKVKEPKKFKLKSSEVKMDDSGQIPELPDDEDFFEKREKERKLTQTDSSDREQKWYNVYPQFPISEDVLDIKESEQIELFNLCKSSFEAEKSTFTKQNPSDSRWLQTALHKGTAKDRANAGALLVSSNPLGNLEALNTLICQTKISNKSSSDVISILTDLWKEVLLPPNRKLISVQMRAGDWKFLRKDSEISKEKQRRIFAYWHFENELKDQYFEFLKNLQQGIQTGQENNKNASIIAASLLLAYAPEKEQMLLTMLINKLGDPLAKIASKALHHLTEVAHKHPNMCGVIVGETEKLLFRNNISDRAQHFALCFLASIAPAGRSEVCTKLVHICFALFKVLVQKGAVNNRTMQAILRCLQKAILEAKPADGGDEIMNKDMQDTIYRLVHLADIRISVQTLSLLLQLITLRTEKSDRFYNALYKKMLDMEVTSIGTKTGAQFLHIIHRAIHIDPNINRAQAFIKRFLQIALYMPPQMAAGCLIVINKLLRSRKELGVASMLDNTEENDISGAAFKPTLPKVLTDDEELAKFDSDGEEKYEDIADDGQSSEEKREKHQGYDNDNKKSVAPSSWHHAKVETTKAKISDISATKYDPYHRAPSYAGAEYALRNELLLLREHFHPTVQVFADKILNQNRIDYYGDPLRDFGLPHFLERFAFKNPKKLDQSKVDIPIIAHKRYVSFGTRGKPVKALTKANCTEDEMFIFNYLEQKRKQAVSILNKTEDDDDDLKPGEVNDDEFEDYLDDFFGKKAKVAAENDLDFLKELGGELKNDETKIKKKKKQTTADNDSDPDMEDVDADWGMDDEKVSNMSDDGAGSIMSDDGAGSIMSDDGAGSIDFDEQGLDDDSEASGSENSDDGNDSDSEAPKSKKSRKQSSALDGRSFAKKLKHSDDMSSLFAAADDFAELLEDTGKTKGQGTSNAIFNKDKSSDKQLKWEEIRRSNSKDFKKRSVGKFSRNKKKAMPVNNKRR